MKIIEGNLALKGNEKIAIINARFNHIITDRLVEGAKDAFLRHGGDEKRGATPHFDYVSAETTKGIANVTLKYAKPVTFGVLTVDNIEQAIERAGSKAGNKGFEAMTGVIEMLNLYKKLGE